MLYQEKSGNRDQGDQIGRFFAKHAIVYYVGG
jgi:hypothetical protein